MQASLFKEEVTDSGYKTAVRLIKAYVLRGDSIQSLKSGMMGYYSSTAKMSISGYLNGKHISSDKILVQADLNGQEVNKIYDLAQVYKDIKENN